MSPFFTCILCFLGWLVQNFVNIYGESVDYIVNCFYSLLNLFQAKNSPEMIDIFSSEQMFIVMSLLQDVDVRQVYNHGYIVDR